MVRKPQGARLLANNGHLTAPVAIEIACLQGVVADIPDNRIAERCAATPFERVPSIAQQQIVNCDLEIEKILREFEPRTYPAEDR
jgi:hypothetical protein